MADYYINASSTSGGDGTTNATSGANRAFPTFEAARAALAAGSTAQLYRFYVTGYVTETARWFLGSGWHSGVSFEFVAHPTDAIKAEAQNKGAGFNQTGGSTLVYRKTKLNQVRVINTSGISTDYNGPIDVADAITAEGAFIRTGTGMLTLDARGTGVSFTFTNSVIDAETISLTAATGDKTLNLINTVFTGRIIPYNFARTLNLINPVHTGQRNSSWALGSNTYPTPTINVTKLRTTGSFSGSQVNGTNSDNQGSLSLSSLFQDWANYDFRVPASTSTLSAGVGTSGGAPATDALGNSRGSSSAYIGAFEFVSGGYTLTADQASFALSGQAVAFTASRLLEAAHTTFTLTGQVVELGYTRVLVLDNGAYTLSGQEAGLQASRSLTADSGAFTLAGQDAGLLAQRLLAADYGAFVVAGQDLQFGNNLAMTAEFAAFAVSGQDAGLFSLRLLSADHGTFALSVQDAALMRLLLITAEHGSLAMSGQQVGLVVTRQLSAAFGAFVLTGQAAALIYAELGLESAGAITAVFVLDRVEPVFIKDAAEVVVVDDVPGVVWL